VREGATAFEFRKNKLIVPLNWEELIVQHDVLAVMHRMAEDGKVQVISSETEMNLSMRDSRSFSLFLDGVMYTLSESGLSNTNYQTQSIIEKVRVFGCLRRSQSAAAALGIPWSLTRAGSSGIPVTNSSGDPLYEMIIQDFLDKKAGKLIASCFCKLFTRVMSLHSPDVSRLEFNKFLLPFEVIWSNLGQIKRDANGKPKYTKSGTPKRYHPEIPRGPWLEADDVMQAKTACRDIFSSLQSIKERWSFDTVQDYLCAVEDLKILYQAQVESVKAITLPLTARLERIGASRSMSKRAFLSKMAQASGEKTVVDWSVIKQNCHSIFVSYQERRLRVADSVRARFEQRGKEADVSSSSA
jgi:hypothetical protein